MYRREIATGRGEIAFIVASSIAVCILGLVITKVFVIPLGWALPLVLVGTGMVSIGLADLCRRLQPM
jgi:hypothetical protein